MPPDTTFAPDLVAFIEAQPRDTPYTVLAELIRQRFGSARAVDPDTLRAWWQATHPVQERCLLRRDSEVHSAILDVAGRLNGREIREMLAARFAPSRLPSRTVLYRFLAQQRSAQAATKKDDAAI